MEWTQIVANLINGVLVILVVQYLKTSGMSWLKLNAPWSLPILALVATQALNFAASMISGFLGYPIDFAPIINVLVGAVAVVTFDVKHVYGKMKLARAA